jgi:hypothetical protein
MEIVKLTSEHTESVKHLFYMKKYMGVDGFDQGDPEFQDRLYEIFCDNYLSDIDSFYALGAVDENNKVHALISFYVSSEEPSWYFTAYRSAGNSYLLKSVLDKIITYNEENGRLKFYTLVNAEHSKLLRKFTWSKHNSERYGYFDEFMVPDRCKCFYNDAWELLYKRTLVPADTVVRCNFLKQEYRTKLTIGGGL